MERVYSLIWTGIVTIGVVAGLCAITVPIYFGTMNATEKEQALATRCIESKGSWIVGPNGYYQCIAGSK